MCLTRNDAEWVSQSSDQCRWRYRRGLACSPLQLSTSEPSAILTAIESFPAHRLRSEIHGKAKLIHRLPGMLTAVVAHPPLCRLIPRSRLTRPNSCFLPRAPYEGTPELRLPPMCPPHPGAAFHSALPPAKHRAANNPAPELDHRSGHNRTTCRQYRTHILTAPRHGLELRAKSRSVGQPENFC